MNTPIPPPICSSGAASLEAVARGDYQWVLAELHPSVALLHHGFYWSCPDKAALSDALRRSVCGQPNFHFGYFAVDFTATTSVRFFDALPDLTYFVAPQRGDPGWKSVPPAECEVFIQPENGDVGSAPARLARISRLLRPRLDDSARLSSLQLFVRPAHAAFALREGGGAAPHLDDHRGGIGRGRFHRDLARPRARGRAPARGARFAAARLHPPDRAGPPPQRGGRPRQGYEACFLDLESYLFLEILHRWLSKAGELEVTEMLPAPDQLLWQEPDGRRTFELRTQVIPR